MVVLSNNNHINSKKIRHNFCYSDNDGEEKGKKVDAKKN